MALFPERKDKIYAAAVTTFSERVLALALKVPAGKVTTYRDIARAAGGAGMAARSVTGILSKAWQNGEKKIPFHRIVYSDGRIWVNDEHRKKRLMLYKKEGIELDKKDRIVDFFDKLYEFKL